MAARTFYAGTRIEHGEMKDGNNEVTIFEQHEKVVGLPPEVMKKLWDAGSLYTKDGDTETTVDTASTEQPES